MEKTTSIKWEVTHKTHKWEYELFCTDGIPHGFEMYCEQTDEHAEGGIWFDDKTLVDYDGVFSIEMDIIKKLEELGFDCEEIKEGLV